MTLTLRFHQTEGGAEPVRDWLRRLGKEARLQVGFDIYTVQTHWSVMRPLVGSMGDGLYEVRSTHFDTEYRVFFCIVESDMWLLHGIVKKSQATPKRELDLARKRKKEVLP